MATYTAITSATTTTLITNAIPSTKVLTIKGTVLVSKNN